MSSREVRRGGRADDVPGVAMTACGSSTVNAGDCGGGVGGDDDGCDYGDGVCCVHLLAVVDDLSTKLLFVSSASCR